MAAPLSRLGSVGLIPQRSEKCLNSHLGKGGIRQRANFTASEKKETSPDHVFKGLAHLFSYISLIAQVREAIMYIHFKGSTSF